MELFPIMVSHIHTNTTEYIPLDVISSHEQQALKNHGQTLQRLADRGGLSYCEALAVLEDRAWDRIEQDEARLKVIEHIRTFNRQLAVDAVPVVRCGECKWFLGKHILRDGETIEFVSENSGLVSIDIGVNCQARCKRLGYIHNLFVSDSGNDSCSHGERRERL